MWNIIQSFPQMKLKLNINIFSNLPKAYIKEEDFLLYSIVVVYKYCCLLVLNISISYLLYCTTALRHQANSIIWKDREETLKHFTCWSHGRDHHNCVKDTPVGYFQFYLYSRKAVRATLARIQLSHNAHEWAASFFKTSICWCSLSKTDIIFSKVWIFYYPYDDLHV